MTTSTTTTRFTLPDRVSGLPLLPAEYSPADWAKLPIGRSHGKKEIAQGHGLGRKVYNLDLDAGPHTLVLGPCSSGKSMLQRQIIAAALTRGHDIYAIDGAKRGIDFRWAGSRLNRTATDRAGSANLLEDVLTEAARRSGLMAAHEVGGWALLPESVLADKGIRPITVIIDEYANLVQEERTPQGAEPLDPEMVREIDEHNATVARNKKAMSAILRRARSVGIHLAIHTQRNDALSLNASMMADIDNLIYMIRPTRQDAQHVAMALHSKASPEALDAAFDRVGDLSLRGTAIAVDATGTVSAVRVAYTDSAQLAKSLNEYLPAHRPEAPKEL